MLSHMIRIAVLLSWMPFAALAQNEVIFPGVGEGSEMLKIYSTLDVTVATPLIEAFQQTRPGLQVDYREMQSLDIYERILEEANQGAPTADLVISSAMDLQMKLANDGYAQPLDLAHDAVWPGWANWRDTAVALTFEPAVIVYHKPSFEGSALPRTREALGALLAAQEASLYGRIGTYDIERSGLGFLFFARDAEHNRAVWSLVQRMGGAGVKLYSNSASILERVADGRFALGYNILGSYAEAWAKLDPDVGIIMPEDYTVVMSRIALVPATARNHVDASRFMDYLMSVEGQAAMTLEANLPALRPDVTGPGTASALRATEGEALRPISVSPGLLVYLDQVKRARLIEQWNEALRSP